MSSVAERREMKPRTDWVVVSMSARIEWKWIAGVCDRGGLTFGLGTRKSEGSTMLGSRAVA